MANQQHIEWLLEGVEAWNARREREDFIPDFLWDNIRLSFETAGKMNEDKRLYLGEANLTGVFLQGANLIETVLRRADLSGADLREANLRGADLTGAYLQGANVWTFVPPIAGIREGDIAKPTDLSQTVGLTQEQVDSMDGDHSTILPDHITRPTYWPEIITGTYTKEQDLSGETESKFEYLSPALRQQIAFLLRVAPSAAATALHTASQIELAVSEARMNAQDEPALFLQMATALKTLGNALSQADDKDIEIARLEVIVATQKVEIERLTALIANMPSAKAQIIVAALGGAGATAITGAIGFMFGSDGANMINNLWQFFNSGGGLPTPHTPLPPTKLI